jgi:hypothetical protein
MLRPSLVEAVLPEAPTPPQIRGPEIVNRAVAVDHDGVVIEDA